MFSTIVHSDGSRFIFTWLFVWGLASPFLYGLIGPQWWRKEAKEYGWRVLWMGDMNAPATPVRTLIMLIEIAIPLAVAWWLFYH